MSEPSSTTDALRKAALIIQRLERRIEAAERAKAEPIAIVGVGCRLPGDVTNLRTFWQALSGQIDTVKSMPRERFDRRAAASGELAVGGVPIVLKGSFIESVADFDADFWRIGLREASWMDPQHRILLECAWEALENAGIVPDRLYGGRVGVYVGTGVNDYGSRAALDTGEPEEAFVGRLGTSFSAGRISSSLGLQGPTLAIDTACSSSLVATHLACQALRNGDCELALAGGVQVMLSVEPFAMLTRIGGLALDGRCKPFSARADGYGRGEGCGVLVLKRLSDARSAGDPVLAVIRGTAVNHDGPRSGRGTPNGSAQSAVMRQALDSAGLTGADVDYVEAHAIGTALGDAIELDAISEVYARGRAAPLRVGSLKGVMGHLEPASGVVGVLKVLASLEHGVLPSSIGDGPLNSNVAWDDAALQIVRQSQTWARGGRPRRAGISAFGLSGTNAHLVLEEAPEPTERRSTESPSARLIVLSAKTEKALEDGARRLAEHLDLHPEQELGDIAFSLATTRTVMDHRLVLVVPSRESLRASVLAAAKGETPPGAIRGSGRALRSTVTSLFSAPDSLELGTGSRLNEEWPVFREAFAAASTAIDLHLELPLRNVLWGQPGSTESALLRTPAYAQPALFAIGWALSALWASWGVRPGVLAGSSSGEITAACVGGVMSLADAAHLVCERGRLLQAVASDREPALERFSKVAESLTYSPSSSATLCLQLDTSGRRAHVARYWVEQALAVPPSRAELRAWAELKGAGTIVEMSAGQGLSEKGPLRQELAILSPMLSNRAETQTLLLALGSWVARGGKPDWIGVFPGTANRVMLPSYPWQRQRCWISDGTSNAEQAALFTGQGRP